MNLVLLLFLLLIALSGFVAWAGDRIGHKIGKRRHSLLGLRPRHTATLMTVFAGMAIALFSFGLMYASVPTFRRVLTDGATLYATNRLLKRENRVLQNGVTLQRAAAARLNDEVENARAGRNAAVAAQKSAEAGLVGAKRQVRDAQDSLRMAQENLDQARGGLAKTQSELRAKQRHIADAGKRVAAAKKRVARARARARGAEQQVRLAVQRRKSAERAAEQVAGFAREQRRRADEQAALAQSAGQEVEWQQTRLAQLDSEVSALEMRRTRLKSALDESLSNTFDLRQSRITYEVGEEVDRLSLPSGLDPAQAQRELARLIARAADKARTRGAKAAPAASEGRTILLVSRQPPAASGGEAGGPSLEGTAPSASGPGSGSEDGGNLSLASEEALLGAAAGAVARAGDDVAVVVVAAANAVEGEPVPIELRTYRNRRVLKQNTVVGRITLDGSRPPAAVADTLYAFLRRDVRRQLLDSGIIPPSPGASVMDGNESVVQIGGGQWLKLLDEVRQIGADAQVVVRAASDLRAADPVTLRFEVVPLRLPVSSGGSPATAAAATALRP